MENLDPPWPMRSPDPSWLPEAPDLHGRLNSLPRFLKPKVLSLPLVSPFPLGPSLGQLSLLRPGGRLSRLLRPGGRLSRLLRPGGRLSRLLRPGGRLSRLLRPGGRLICQSHPTVSVDLQSHPTSPSTCQSHPTSPSTCQSHPTSPVDLPESPHVSADLPESPHVSADLPESPHVSADLPESPHVSADLPESPHVSADLPESPTSPPTCQSHLTSRRPARVTSRLRRPARVTSRLRRPARVTSRLRRPCRSHLTSPRPVPDPARVTSRLRRPARVTSRLRRPARVTSVSAVSSAPPWWAPVSLAPHGPGPPFPPRFHLRSTTLLEYAVCKRLEAALWGGGSVMNLVPTHSKLHITHGLHFPSCTALTHSRPPLHQSHSCHHSLINSDCLTTPAPHSLTHIKAAHKHSPSAKSCFPPGYISERSPIHPAISVFDPGLPDLGTLEPVLWPRPLPGIVTSLLCLWYSCFCLLTIACVILPLSNKYILLHLDPLPFDQSFTNTLLLK